MKQKSMESHSATDFINKYTNTNVRLSVIVFLSKMCVRITLSVNCETSNSPESMSKRSERSHAAAVQGFCKSAKNFLYKHTTDFQQTFTLVEKGWQRKQRKWDHFLVEQMQHSTVEAFS